MKMKNGETYNELIPSLTELIKMKTPFKVNYAANKTLNGLSGVRKTIDETRDGSFKKYCLMENGKPIIKDNNYQFANDFEKAKAINEVNELFELENDVEIHTVSIDLVDKIEGDTGGTWINYLIGKFFVETKTEDSPLEIVK